MLLWQKSPVGKTSIVSTLILVIFPTHLLGHTLDTMCVTQLRLGEPVTRVSYVGIVSGFDEDADLSYRRAANTRNYHRDVESTRCNHTSSEEEKVSCGFFRTMKIMNFNHSEYDEVLNGGRVVLTDSEEDEEEKKFLTFGVFHCIASKYNFTEISTVTIMSPHAVFRPTYFTITVNLEDKVHLTMIRSTTMGTTNIKWRHIWETTVVDKPEWDGNLNPVITKASSKHAGVYEAYTASSDIRYSGYIRLIVRACRLNSWGSSSCEWTCPVCYNGGICDDKSGRCICPPGFTGDRCENACPDGFIGQKCDVRCSLISNETDCKGIEICLPHPFGCTCAPGYTGHNCATRCARGSYGAGCTQTCHCSDNDSCNVRSGRCLMNSCEPSWGGPMCQVKVLDVYGYGYQAAVNTDKGLRTSQVEAFTSLTTSRNDTKLRITRGLDTGTGNTGSGLSNHDVGRLFGSNVTGLPPGELSILFNERGGQKLRLESSNADFKSLGVFNVEAEHNGRRQYSAVLRLSNEARNVPSKFTWTIGTGETVTLSLTDWQNQRQLMWRHNGGGVITRGNGKTSLTIFQARKADEGVYVCTNTNGHTNDLAIILLKVRACPSGKWGIYCNNTCPVCYYQGICHDETGECVCQAGYYGHDCSQTCSRNIHLRRNLFGQQCTLQCEDTSPNRCRYKQLCSPDPVGCHCHAGYSNNKCSKECAHPMFGTDCSMSAYCSSWYYDAVAGCRDSGRFHCNSSYEGPGCQVRRINQRCPGTEKYYGTLCNYPCHCKNDILCERTGSCGVDGCAEGWAGSNCSEALPALLNAPVIDIINYEVLVIWDLWRSGVDYGTGPVEYYVVQHERNGVSSKVNVTGYSVFLEGLDPLETYSISVAAVKEVERTGLSGPFSTPVSVTSSCGKPYFYPIIDDISQSDGTGLLLRWRIEAPDRWMECTPSIRVYYTSNEYIDGFDTKDYSATEREIMLQDLKPCTTYEVYLGVVYVNGKASACSTSVTAVTNSSGFLPEIVIEEKEVSQTIITIAWKLLGEGDPEWSSTGEENQYKFLLTMETPGGNITTATYNLTQQSHTETDLETYTTYIFNITLEDCAGRKGLEKSIQITTEPIKITTEPPVTTPTSEMKTQSLRPKSSKPQPSGSSLLPVVLPISLLLLLLLIVIAIFLIFIKRRNKQGPTARTKVENSAGAVNKSSEMMPVKLSADVPPSTEFVTPSLESTTPSTETEILYSNLASDAFCIALEDLHNYVQSKKLETDGFKKEFEDLMKGKQMPCTVGEAKANIKKNRFKNIVTYDHSRVKLPIINNDSSSDYYNASYINGYDKPKAFIASQGPNKASLNDFWRMIWHVKCKKIIMLANTVEAGKPKCEQYWSDNDKPHLFADVCVKTTKQVRKGEVVTRRFSLSKDDEVHDVIQYHFTGWPDMKVPQSADVLWEILDQVEKDETEHSPPIVVHCSAGCGRTGTIIALSAMRKMMRKEGKVNVFRFVNEMRGQRTTMVQICDQYEFIYESLLTYGLVGKTSVRATDFSGVLGTMKSLNGNQSTLEKQFNVLKYLNPCPDHLPEQCGSLPINSNKNRFPSMIPLESFRPKLMTDTEDATATDYINASFCDGYKQKDLFISTQIPLSNTVVDFWRLVFDYKCFVVVLFENESDQDGAIYFPLEGRSQYGPFTVETVERDEMTEITRKTFRLSKTNKYYLGENKPYLITQFSLHQSVIGNKANLLHLIEKVQRERRQRKGGRIALLCWNGVDVNSVFVAVYNSCERLRDDGIVCLFSLVRELRERSPQMVGSMEQYEFCMDAIQHQIDSTSLYANT
ncbi:Receptor-type tyrosine-protein phosphatase T [Holothuria leucospilota]|uniref:protein-tyrosine-phosphatase n=1 Tax=Holothuria leucospilota TaxID=206669 RepID=A0A9Q1C944_HOLLE|nr:Receptor-type tyrosine-protein phosphatase T [Holothuria leucospilota]